MGHKSVQEIENDLILSWSLRIFFEKVTKPKLNWRNCALSIVHYQNLNSQ